MAVNEKKLNVVGCWENFIPTGVLAATKPFEWPLPYYPSGSTAQEIVMDVIQANMLFFLQPGRLWKLFKNSFDRKGTKWFVLPARWWMQPRYILGVVHVIYINISRLFLLLKWKFQGKLLTQYKGPASVSS
jgi:hypothetical protein